MNYFFTAAALLAATVVADKRDLCADGSTDDNNNWYCQNVTAITYTGVGGTGSYNKVTSMDSGNGQCGSSPQEYSGSLSPLDEEVSLHFRGPINLKKFAAYTPGSPSNKSRRSERRHAHAHAHGHAHHARAVGDIVTATIDGQVVSWTNEWSGQPSTAAPAPPAASSDSSPPVVSQAQNWAAPASSASPDSSVASATSSGPPAASSSSSNAGMGSIGSTAGGWGRQASYDSSSGSKDGLVFLNHQGGSGSGTFDYTFGNSLSFASADGTTGASSAQTLEDTTIPSVNEVVIFTDQKCSGQDGDCGYYRPDTVAYHGFDGPSKAFFFEFVMPDSGETASSIYSPVNMPAIWMLNAQIPRTLQYGQADCSCWGTGCGEFDIFEVLAPGDTRAKSTLHGNIAGGDSDYFQRPEDQPITVGLILYDNNIHIKILDQPFDFGDSIDSGTINDILGSTLKQTKTVSLFALGG